MYDQSQDDGPNIAAFQFWMRKLLVEEVFITTFIDIFVSEYFIARRSGRNLQVKGSGGVQLATGATITTILNSLNNIFMFCWCLERCKVEKMDIEKFSKELGFTTKLRLHGTAFQRLTFLKGWWCPDLVHSRFLWLPLPSAVLKLGKFLRPIKFFDVKNGPNGKTVCATMTSRSYAGVPRVYPVFGPFLGVMDRFSCNTLEVGEGDFVNENYFKPTLDCTVVLDLVLVEEMICERYGCSPMDLARVAFLYKSVHKLPSYVQHPLFEIMQQVDYC
jgi:hypothetical protein